MPRLPPSPDLEWSPDGGSLRATAFGDVYFSKDGGLAESEAVFLAGTGLPERWKNRDRFALCELGFGTGLNIFATWRAWKKTRSPHAQLHISTIESFPLAKADAARALAHFPEISEQAAKLLAVWPVRAYAPQRFWFPDDGLSLTMFTGDAETILAGLTGVFDAWYLDGFAPARNPAMWSPAIFRAIARLSAPHARVATFSVAGDVRRGLEAAGFAVEKRPGFGQKRKRLEATFAGPSATAASSLYPYRAVEPKRVAIIGAGIAGASVAHALARRGVETVVLDAARQLGAGGSGNPAGLVMPRLDRAGPLSEVHLAAYLHAVALYEALAAFENRGVEQFAQLGGEAALADLLNDPPLPAEWFSRLPGGAAFHARAGVVRPLSLIARMLEQATLIMESEVRGLDRDSNNGWIVRSEGGRALLSADAIVLACGTALTQFAPASFLPIARSSGQIEWGSGAPPRHATTRGNYLAPFEGGVLFGATFDKALAPEADARARNLAALRNLAPEVAASMGTASLQSRASERATTPDRAPIVGLLPNAEAWLAQYAGLAHGRAIKGNTPPPAHDGVYVVGGLGARGLTLAPLLGEVLAGEMCGEPALLSQLARDAIHPARFLHRALKRR